MHNFKTGRYATATSFVVDPSSSPELTVNADTGIVATNGDITEAGIYVLIVSVASPDYIGRARLALGLTLEGVFTDAETIGDGDRNRTVAVASGHSGSVAFFAAGKAGVTLRTPSSVPSGFNLGAGGLDADFAAPAGFTLFLDAGRIAGGETATAAFAVTATDAFFAASEISLTVVVSAVAAPEQAALTASELDANYNDLGHDLSAPEGFGFADATLSVLGEHGTRFTIVSDKLQPVDADDAARRPEVGKYAITVEMTHGGFLGTLTLSVSVRIQESLSVDAVLRERERVQDAVAGHFGTAGDAGHLLTVGSGYTLAALTSDAGSSVRALADRVYEVRLLNALGNSTVTASLEGDVECVDASLDCEPLRLSVTVYFSPLVSPANVATLDWQDFDEAFFPNRFRLNVPGSQEFRDASYDLVAASLDGARYAEPRLSRFALDFSGNVVVRTGGAFPALGVHELLFDVTRSGDNRNRGFLGVLTLTMTIHVVRGPLLPNWRLRGGDVQRAAVAVARGYAGLVHEAELDTEHESAGLRTAGAAPAGFSADVAGSALTGLTARVFLTGQTPAPTLETVTFEVYHTNPTNAANYASSVRGQSVIVSVAEVLAPAQNSATADYLRGFTVDLNFPSGYESVAGRSVTILYPLPREGALAGSKAVCETLGGTHTADLDVCTGYSASSDHAPYVSDALKIRATPSDDLSSRGACTWTANPLLASAYYSCESAFAQARACNLANKAAKDNGSCADAECGAGEFALGGKCLALRASGGRLEHAPTGAGNALPAGSHVIAAGMTQSDLLGTVRLDVTATIGRLSLNAADFSLSEPAPSSVVTVASGALNVELARVWLTASALSVSEFGAHVSGVDKSAFPANLSLEILPVPENQTVVFYLSGTLAAGSEAERTATLEVASLDPNYAPVGQTVTLRIATLPYPARAEAVGQVGAGSPYNSASLHDFKTGRYATATNFAVDPSSSPELTVDADTGIVATKGDITEAGIYVLIVSVASPDYVGRARLVFGLTLEGIFTDAETIADGDRSRTVAVAPGHSGSVAFFAAGKAGVTLRTPSSVPSGFNLGADGLDADFAAPAGFTLFLDAGGIAGGETATAAFAVTATEAFFAASEISLTVVVSALGTPPTASASGETFSAGFPRRMRGMLSDKLWRERDMKSSAYSGAHFEETSSSDLSVAADGQVSTREKLGVG